VGDDLTLRRLVETCVSENDRWMAQFDLCPPRSTLFPKMMRLLLQVMPRSAVE
jgi:hypothetical protein